MFPYAVWPCSTLFFYRCCCLGSFTVCFCSGNFICSSFIFDVVSAFYTIILFVCCCRQCFFSFVPWNVIGFRTFAKCIPLGVMSERKAKNEQKKRIESHTLFIYICALCEIVSSQQKMNKSSSTDCLVCVCVHCAVHSECVTSVQQNEIYRPYKIEITAKKKIKKRYRFDKEIYWFA